jgi:hypothetical protein
MFVFVNLNRWVDRSIDPYVRTFGAFVILGLVSTAAWWIAERPLVRLPPVRGPRRPEPRPVPQARRTEAEGDPA